MTGLSLEAEAVLVRGGESPATGELVRVFGAAGAHVFVEAERDPGLDASWLAKDGKDFGAVFAAVAKAQERLHSLVEVVHGPTIDARSMPDRAFDVVESIRLGARRFGVPPRHVVVMHCAREPGAQLGPRLLRTCTRYLAAHLSGQPTHINLVSHPATPLGYARAAQCTLALCSGWLDAMNGQHLEVGEYE